MKIQHGQKNPQKWIFFFKYNFFPAFVEKYVEHIFFLFLNIWLHWVFTAAQAFL